MNTINAILEPNADGTLHLPLPAELRHGKIEVTATLRPINGAAADARRATPQMVALRKASLQKLRDMGGLGDPIPDPQTWQRQERQDRPLPERG